MKIPDKILINKKIKELLGLSNNLFNNLPSKSQLLDKLIDELKQLSIKNNTYLGRILTFNNDDSKSIYLITKVKRIECDINWINYPNTSMYNDELNKKCSLMTSYIDQFIAEQDFLDSEFKKIS